MTSKNKDKYIVSVAKDAMKMAYNPYSKFAVGAAVKAKSGEVYVGCNIENASYSATCCAERVAIFSAVANGEKEFEKIAVIGNTEDPIVPCGVCAQVMSEFFSPETTVILANTKGDLKICIFKELMPMAFSKEDL